jgi:hypothetical protein
MAKKEDQEIIRHQSPTVSLGNSRRVRKSIDCGCRFGFGSLDPQRDTGYRSFSLSKDMDPNAAQTARESLDLAFHTSNVLDTELDRHTHSG